MNRLKELTVYLSGPIDFAEDGGCQWRDMMGPFLENMNVKVFNPLKHIFHGAQALDEIKRPLMARLIKEKKFKELREEMKEVNHWDLRALDLSSFLVVNYDVDVFTCGTHEEIFTANHQNKPVLLMVGDKLERLPKWIYGRFPPEHLFISWDDLKEYLQGIDSDPDFEFSDADEKRWLFYSGSHMES